MLTYERQSQTTDNWAWIICTVPYLFSFFQKTSYICETHSLDPATVTLFLYKSVLSLSPSPLQMPVHHNILRAQHSLLFSFNSNIIYESVLFLRTWFIVKYSKSESTKFREPISLPSSGENIYSVASCIRG